jgi:DNA-3-methyladenine glycosylase II
MTTFTIPRPHGFSLAAASDFYAGFTPGSGMAAAATDRLTLAFRLDRSFAAVAASLREVAGQIVVEFAGTRDMTTLRGQVSRILGLDADGHAWLALGRRDPRIGALQAAFPGFFTAAKPSPYDAAVWSIIAPRLPISRAAQVKMDLAREHGDAVELDGRVHHIFPGPEKLAGLEHIAGLNDEKVARLRGIAAAALDGRLDADHLLGLGEDRALAELQELRGIGPWAASHIYYRGAAPRDAWPTAEPRVLHGLASACGIEVPTEAEGARIADGWRPFRMWVAVLLSRHLAATGGWHTPGLARERAAAGRALAKRTRRAKLG